MRFTLSRFLSMLLEKTSLLVLRVIDYVKCLPTRLGRLLSHLAKGLFELLSGSIFRKGHRNGLAWTMRRIGGWYLQLLVYVLESLGIGELYETMLDFVKFNTRSLHPWEVELARSVYGDGINYRRIRIDESAFLGPRQKRFCYVSFFVINSWGPMANALLIHELIHIWQYQRVGAMYMLWALWAQRTEMGYDYGGIERLKWCKQNRWKLQDFNFEQQGEIVADYHRLKTGYRPVWGLATRSDVNVYEYFVKHLQEG
ncbi:MAG: hypothetical protein AAFV95_14160 [Bacteroidota bacterium]